MQRGRVHLCATGRVYLCATGAEGRGACRRDALWMGRMERAQPQANGGSVSRIDNCAAAPPASPAASGQPAATAKPGSALTAQSPATTAVPKGAGPHDGATMPARTTSRGFVIFHPSPGRELRGPEAEPVGQLAPLPAAAPRDAHGAASPASKALPLEAASKALPLEAAPMLTAATSIAATAPSTAVGGATGGNATSGPMPTDSGTVPPAPAPGSHPHSETALFLDAVHGRRDKEGGAATDAAAAGDTSHSQEVWMADVEVWQAMGGAKDVDKEGAPRRTSVTSKSVAARPAGLSTPKRSSTSSVAHGKPGMSRRRRNSETKDMQGITQIDASVLVVDDNKVNRTVAGSILRKFFKRVLYAENGMDALNQVTAGIPDLKLIFMDIQMPVLDGNQSTVLIRNHLQSKGLPLVPVVCVTAHASLFSKEQLAKVGYDSCLYKPISVDDVNTVVRGYLEMYLQEEAMVAVSSSPTLTAAPTTKPMVNYLGEMVGAPGKVAASHPAPGTAESELASRSVSAPRLPAARDIRVGLEKSHSHSSSVYSIPSPGPGLSEEESHVPDYWGKGARNRPAQALGNAAVQVDSPPSGRGPYQFDPYRADESGSRSSMGASASFSALLGVGDGGPHREAAYSSSMDSSLGPPGSHSTGVGLLRAVAHARAGGSVDEDMEKDELILAEAEASLSPMASDISRPSPTYLKRLSGRRLSTSSLSNSADLRLIQGRNRRMSVGPMGNRPSPLSTSLTAQSLDNSTKTDALPGWPTARTSLDRNSHEGERPLGDTVAPAGSAAPALRPPGYVPDESFAAKLLHGVDAATLSMASFPPLEEVAAAPAGMPVAAPVPLARLSPASFSHGPGAPHPSPGAAVGVGVGVGVGTGASSSADSDGGHRSLPLLSLGEPGPEVEVRHSTATLQALMKLKQSHHGSSAGGNHHGGLGVKVGSLMSGFIRRKSEPFPSPTRLDGVPLAHPAHISRAKSEDIDQLPLLTGGDAAERTRRQSSDQPHPVRRAHSETAGPLYGPAHVPQADAGVVPRQRSVTEDAVRGSLARGAQLGSTYPGSRHVGTDREELLVPPSSHSVVMGGLWSPGLQHFAENAARQAASSTRGEDALDGGHGGLKKLPKRRVSLGDTPSSSSPMSSDSSIISSLITKLRRRSFRSGLGRISRVSQTPVQPMAAVGFGP
eukprot:jgi/Mesvir1/25431/Mv01710-RA.3